MDHLSKVSYIDYCRVVRVFQMNFRTNIPCHIEGQNTSFDDVRHIRTHKMTVSFSSLPMPTCRQGHVRPERIYRENNPKRLERGEMATRKTMTLARNLPLNARTSTAKMFFLVHLCFLLCSACTVMRVRAMTNSAHRGTNPHSRRIMVGSQSANLLQCNDQLVVNKFG